MFPPFGGTKVDVFPRVGRRKGIEMKKTCIRTVLALILSTAGASGTTLTYTDRTNWEAAVNTITLYNLGIDDPGQGTVFPAGGLIVSDLQVTGWVNTGQDLSRITPDSPPGQPWYQWGSGPFLRSGDKTGSNTVYIRIAFSAPVAAYGFNFGGGGGFEAPSTYGLPASITVTPQGIASSTVTTGYMPNWSFFGVTSTSQTFSYVDIAMNTTDRYVVIDDIAKALVNEAPPPPPPPSEIFEPGTLLQIGIGSALFLAGRRRFSMS